MAKVLVVEDDADLRELVVRGLREEGFEVAGAATAGDLFRRHAADRADVLVLDVGLPDADGRDVCQALRAQGDDTPVLFLSARDAVTDRVGGFSAGGDDYVTKPFALAEVIARLHALVRRGTPPGEVSIGALRLDPVAHAAFVGGERIALTPTEFRLLARLAAAPGATVRRRELLQAAWPLGARVRENTLDAYVARLRRKLAAQPGTPEIVTAHGVGYRMS